MSPGGRPFSIASQGNAGSSLPREAISTCKSAPVALYAQRTKFFVENGPASRDPASLRNALREPVARLYGTHPDDIPQQP